MSIMTRQLLSIACGIVLCLLHPAWAETDKEIQEKALKAREISKSGAIDHSAHNGSKAEASGKFRGVFYGYLPCHEELCDGIKMTLSLNARNNYLLVIQPAKPLNRESFEKGRYVWDDAKGELLLTPSNSAEERRLTIKDQGKLLYHSSDGRHLSGDQGRYLLERSDQSGNREVHIH